VNAQVTYAETRAFAQSLTLVLERSYPDLIVSTQDKSRRPGKVLIDWSQNSSFKTTVAVYSLRARDQPSVSTPVTWEEIESAVEAEDGAALRFSPDAVLERIAARGDLMAPVLEVAQDLPSLG
jgi:bifunctional non-homologous end joining protein LigD